MGYTSSISKHSRKVFPNSKNGICNTIISHVNSNESNNLNTSNSDNGILMSNFTHSNVQNII